MVIACRGSRKHAGAPGEADRGRGAERAHPYAMQPAEPRGVARGNADGRNATSFSLSLSRLSVYVCVCVCLPLSLSLYLSIYLSIYLSLSLSLSQMPISEVRCGIGKAWFGEWACAVTIASGEPAGGVCARSQGELVGPGGRPGRGEDLVHNAHVRCCRHPIPHSSALMLLDLKHII